MQARQSPPPRGSKPPSFLSWALFSLVFSLMPLLLTFVIDSTFGTDFSQEKSLNHLLGNGQLLALIPSVTSDTLAAMLLEDNETHSEMKLVIGFTCLGVLVITSVWFAIVTLSHDPKNSGFIVKGSILLFCIAVAASSVYRLRLMNRS